jgi:hypothetical protein
MMADVIKVVAFAFALGAFVDLDRSSVLEWGKLVVGGTVEVESIAVDETALNVRVVVVVLKLSELKVVVLDFCNVEIGTIDVVEFESVVDTVEVVIIGNMVEVIVTIVLEVIVEMSTVLVVEVRTEDGIVDVTIEVGDIVFTLLVVTRVNADDIGVEVVLIAVEEYV